MEQTLIQHYRNLLPMARTVADEKGTIRAVMTDGERKIHIVRGKIAVLPTQHHLNAENGSELIFFHPFLEDGGKRVSESVDDYRSRVQTTIGLCVLSLMQKLATVASSEEHSPPLKTQQIKMMQKLKDLDAPAFKQISAVLSNILLDPEYRKSHWPIKLFMGSRGESPREKDSKNFNYWTTVTFPLFDEINSETESDAPKGGRKFAGTTVSNKTMRCLKSLMEYIFSHIGEDNWYSSGSDSDVAPFMVSLLKSMTELVTEINEAIEFFVSQPGFEEIKLPTDWMESLSALPSLYREIVAIPVRGQAARVRTETTGDALAPSTSVKPVAARPAQQAQESTVRYARDQSEYVLDANGRVVRNPNFVSTASIGTLGTLTYRSPYDPRSSPVIIPDSGVYAPDTSTHNGGAWGQRNNSGWGNR